MIDPLELTSFETPVEDVTTLVLFTPDVASGALSPMIPLIKGRVPDSVVPVEAGSKCVIEVGTEIVEKIPASPSSICERSRGKCSPARLILYVDVDQRCAALDQ